MTLAGGVYGQWYYNGPNAPQLKGANAKAFGRASTTSLGSVAFGSLIVTVLEVIKQVLNAVSRNERAEGDGERQFVSSGMASFARADLHRRSPQPSALSWLVSRLVVLAVSVIWSSILTVSCDSVTVVQSSSADLDCSCRIRLVS